MGKESVLLRDVFWSRVFYITNIAVLIDTLEKTAILGYNDKWSSDFY